MSDEKLGSNMRRKIEVLSSKVAEVNKKTAAIIDKNNITGPLKNEFKLKTDQYNGMMEDLYTMLEYTDKQETIDNIMNQQIEVLRVRIEWEQDILKRIKKAT